MLNRQPFLFKSINTEVKIVCGNELFLAEMYHVHHMKTDRTQPFMLSFTDFRDMKRYLGNKDLHCHTG